MKNQIQMKNQTQIQMKNLMKNQEATILGPHQNLHQNQILNMSFLDPLFSFYLIFLSKKEMTEATKKKHSLAARF